MKKLFNSPVYNAFSQWKHAMGLPSSFRQPKPVSLETLHVNMERIEAVLSKLVSDPPPGRPQDLHILQLTDAVEKIQLSMSRHDDTLRRIEEKMSRMERHGSEGPKRPHGGANAGGQRGEEGQSPVGTMLGSDIIVVGKGKQEEREEVKLQSLSQLTAKKKMGRMHKVHSMPIHSETTQDEKLNGSSSAVYARPSQTSPQSSNRLDKFLPNGDPPDGDCPRLPAETCGGKGDYVKLSWFELPVNFDSLRSSSILRREQARAESVKVLLYDTYHVYLKVGEDGVARECFSAGLGDGGEGSTETERMGRAVEQLCKEAGGLAVERSSYVDVHSRDGTGYSRFFQAR